MHTATRRVVLFCLCFLQKEELLGSPGLLLSCLVSQLAAGVCLIWRPSWSLSWSVPDDQSGLSLYKTRRNNNNIGVGFASLNQAGLVCLTCSHVSKNLLVLCAGGVHPAPSHRPPGSHTKQQQLHQKVLIFGLSPPPHTTTTQPRRECGCVAAGSPPLFSHHTQLLPAGPPTQQTNTCIPTITTKGVSSPTRLTHSFQSRLKAPGLADVLAVLDWLLFGPTTSNSQEHQPGPTSPNRQQKLP